MATDPSNAATSKPATKYPSFPHKPISPGLAGSLFLVSAGAAVLVALITFQNLTGPQLDKLKNLQGMVFTVKGLVFTPAYWVIEELVFRGFFLQVFRRKFPLLVAMVLSGLLFALEHFAKGGPDMIEAFVFSFYFAWLMVRTDSLYAPIIAHCSFDAVAYFVVSPIAFTYGHLADGRYSFPWWWYGTAFLIFVAGGWTLCRALKASPKAVSGPN